MIEKVGQFEFGLNMKKTLDISLKVCYRIKKI